MKFLIITLSRTQCRFSQLIVHQQWDEWGNLLYGRPSDLVMCIVRS